MGAGPAFSGLTERTLLILRFKSFQRTTLSIFLILSIMFSAVGCGKKEPEYESLEAELYAVMQDRISNTLVMRMDDTSGTSYFYLDDTLCVMYQPRRFSIDPTAYKLL